jgi:hypothetical protein
VQDVLIIVIRLVNKHRLLINSEESLLCSQQTSKANIIIEWISILRHILVVVVFQNQIRNRLFV